MSSMLTNCAAPAPRRALPASSATDRADRPAEPAWIRRPRQFALLSVFLAMVIGSATAFMALADGYHSNPWLLSWIPATCCVTNDCCWEVSERELRALPNDEWEVRSTGQVRKRTAWSPDGKFYRCACDYDNIDKHWIKHQGANTRCIFVPMRSAAASFPRRSPAH